MYNLVDHGIIPILLYDLTRAQFRTLLLFLIGQLAYIQLTEQRFLLLLFYLIYFIFFTSLMHVFRHWRS